MKMYHAEWASTEYVCDNCGALCRILRELGVSSFLMAIPYDSSVLQDELLNTFDVIVWEEEVEV